MSDNEQYCKVIFLGEGSTGKTSIINNLLGKQFEYETLITAAHGESEKINMEIDNKKLKVDLWDTNGQERFRSIAKLNYKNADIAILVYDITNSKSFDEIQNYWYNEVKSNTDTIKVIGLFGNKSDLIEKEEVDEEDLMEYAKNINAIYARTSAKNGNGIKETFNKILKEFINQKKVEVKQKSITITKEKNQDQKEKEKKKGCC